jgi:cation diffusion facilitator CzcD-associated flavoprotein CzcO
VNQIFHVIGEKGRTATQIDTIIIGGGQAGLSVSYYLTQLAVPHLVLERASQVAEAWRNRWDSFTLNTTNWESRWPWLHNARSGLLHGTGQDAVHIAKMIADNSEPLVTSPASPAFVHYGSALGDPGLYALDLS